MKDGWHTIYGYEIWVEGNRVLRGLGDNKRRTTHPYRVSKKYGYVNDTGLTVNAFKSGIKRGTVVMH